MNIFHLEVINHRIKKISVVYRNRENFPAIEYLKKNLESVFENYIQVNNYFLDELSDNAIIDGDIFLIFLEYMIYPLKKHIKNFNNAIVMNRGIDKKFISEISNIPSNTDVLVVNDSYESTIQTTNTFYELGISHINFIPYDKKLDNNNYYNDIEIAITPNEESLVPKFIKNIIDIIRSLKKSLNQYIIRNYCS